VPCGLTGPARAQLQTLLSQRVRAQPVVPGPGPAVWVEPTLYGEVRFLEWTRAGHLRGARFHGLLEAPPAVRLCPLD
jgi:ATP-dependent DNA ligase